MARGIFHGGISIQRKSRVSDGKGGWTSTFSTVASVSGRLTPLSLSEQDRAQQSVGVVTHRFSTAGTTDVKRATGWCIRAVSTTCRP